MYHNILNCNRGIVILSYCRILLWCGPHRFPKQNMVKVSVMWLGALNNIVLPGNCISRGREILCKLQARRQKPDGVHYVACSPVAKKRLFFFIFQPLSWKYPNFSERRWCRHRRFYSGNLTGRPVKLVTKIMERSLFCRCLSIKIIDCI